MRNTDAVIHDVSDTSIWVAYYRAKESERPDALFRDPLAKLLIGERGKKIAEDMASIGPYTEWSVLTRTLIIDEFIETLVREGVDTVINLGAGLDTRPYRMNLPSHLKWIEVDYSHIIELKNKVLRDEKPVCELRRVALDLSDEAKRDEFFSSVDSSTLKTLVLTEGVIPYLTEPQVDSLAQALHKQNSFCYWITEYFDPQVYRHLKGTLRHQKMRNAPFLFYPADWLGFFKQRHWVPREIRYSGEEGMKRGRRPPMPWFGRLFLKLAPKSMTGRFARMAGYMLLER